MKLDLELVQKYDVPGPRYTSYPTALQFREQFSAPSFENYLRSRNEDPRDISLYFHIPFCFSLCWYCGCTKIVTRDQDRARVYLDYLRTNMDQLISHLHNESEVVQIHFGGGTPTFLEPDQIRREIIMQIMCKNFVSFDSFEDRWDIDMHHYFAPELKQLQVHEEDGLLHLHSEGFELTEDGRFFVRNIAMVFDRYLSRAKQKRAFSNTV